jgi:ribosomal-protein-serine acetyltransferase
MSAYNFPETFIGDTIILEKLSEFHADDLYEVLDNNREHISKWLLWLTAEYTIDDLYEFIELKHEEFLNDENFPFVIIDKESDRVLGYVELFKRNSGSMEFGYYLDKNTQGSGIISQAILLLEEFLFSETNIMRLNISTEVENAKSAMVAKRNGYLFEGLIYNKRLKDNIATDMLHFTKLKDETKMHNLKNIENKLIDIFDVKILKNK